MVGMAGQVAAGVWLKTVQDLSSACDRATRSCALRELRANRIRVMQNPSASGTAGLRDCAARSGIGVDRAEAMQDPTSARPERRPFGRIEDRDGRVKVMQNPSAPSATRDSFAWIEDRDDRIKVMQDSSGSSAAGPRSGTGPECSSHHSPGGGLSPRSGRRSPIRVLPGGQAARRRKQHSAGHRRLTSRQVPDCLRGSAEERARPRNPTTPNPSPLRQRQHPRNPGISLRGKARAGGEILKPQPAPPTQRVGGWSDETGGAKRPPTPRRPP